jgi:hypothetical protein
MFSHLTSQLSAELETAQRVLVINEALRDLLIVHQTALTALPAELTAGADDNMNVAHALSRLVPGAPSKVDWQIYDHCAALTRIYAAYERFVGELVAEYVRLLPKLYGKYSDLPESITTQHRVGIGQILLKMGEKGLYKKLEEQVVVRELAAGLSGASGYTLLADAFFIDRQNLRFDVLGRLFGALGFRRWGRYINRHAAVTDFIKQERADSSSPQKELDAFIEYRNEAAHKKVENVLSIDAIGAMSRFIGAIGRALAEMVEEGVLQRRMEMGHYSQVLAVSEIHHDGFVVIGIPLNGVPLAVGDEVLLCGKSTCQRVAIESLRINDQSVVATTGDGATEVGLRLTKRSAPRADLRRLNIPIEAPAEIQLILEDAMPAMVEAADTDSVESAEGDTNANADGADQPGEP